MSADQNLEEEFFSSPPPPPAPRSWRWLRWGVGLAGLIAVLAIVQWAPWRPPDRAVGHHPSARLTAAQEGFDPAIRHHGAVVPLSTSAKADPRRTLLELTIVEPLARVALVDDFGDTKWSMDWPPPRSTLRLDVDPGLWRYVQGREELRGQNGPVLEERQQLDLRAGQAWELRTTPPAAADGGVSYAWPDLPW